MNRHCLQLLNFDILLQYYKLPYGHVLIVQQFSIRIYDLYTGLEIWKNSFKGRDSVFWIYIITSYQRTSLLTNRLNG